MKLREVYKYLDPSSDCTIRAFISGKEMNNEEDDVGSTLFQGYVFKIPKYLLDYEMFDGLEDGAIRATSDVNEYGVRMHKFVILVKDSYDNWAENMDLFDKE